MPNKEKDLFQRLLDRLQGEESAEIARSFVEGLRMTVLDARRYTYMQCYIACVELLPALTTKLKFTEVRFDRIRGDRRRFSERVQREKELERARNAVADLRENMQALREHIHTEGY